jgi:hypothetical protein
MDGNGCSFTTETYEIAFQDSLPVAAFSYELNGGRVAFTNTSRHATQYEWDFGDGVNTSTAADPVFLYAQNDSFTVRLIAIGPCGRDTSYAGFRMTQVSIGQPDLAGSLELYPNPATGPVRLRLREIQLSRTDLQLIGPDGRLCWSRPYAALNGSVEIPVTGLAPGVYFLRIVSDELYQTLPLVIP